MLLGKGRGFVRWCGHLVAGGGREIVLERCPILTLCRSSPVIVTTCQSAIVV